VAAIERLKLRLKFIWFAVGKLMPATQNRLTSCIADSHRDICPPVQKEIVTLTVAKGFETGRKA
jgi:hypothetical protein